MKKFKCKKTTGQGQLVIWFLLAITTLYAQVANGQSERFLWEKHYYGVKIDFKEMDSVGNLYIAGRFGSLRTLDEELICPADTNEWVRPSEGVFLAKYDTSGVLQWCRSVKNWDDGGGMVCGISIQRDEIYFMFHYDNANSLYLPGNPLPINTHCWLFFFDTTYYGIIDGEVQPYGSLPYVMTPFLCLATFDTDGNRLDTKFALVNTDFYATKYVRDKSGNHYLTVIQPSYLNGHVSIELNDDSLQKFYYPPCYNEYCPRTPFLIKINRDWDHADIYRLTDTVDNFTSDDCDSVFALWDFNVHRMSVDDEGHIFLSGHTLGSVGGYSHMPLSLGFNNGDRLIQEFDFGHVIFNICIDTMGNVVWIRQLFNENLGPASFMANGGDNMSFANPGLHAFDSSYYYYVATALSSARSVTSTTPDQYTNVYFDYEHHDTLIFPNEHQHLVAAVVKYDKYTGEYISHISLPSDSIGTRSLARPCVVGDYILLTADDNHVANLTYKINQKTSEIEHYDTIISSLSVRALGVQVSDYGFVEKWYLNNDRSLQSSNFYIPPNTSCILYYYDSLWDKRRHVVQPEDTTHTPDSVSVVDVELINLSVYPNPTDNVLNVSTSIPMTWIEIYDVEGRMVEQRKIQTTSHQFDMRHYQQGVYIMKVFTDRGITIVKIQKI